MAALAMCNIVISVGAFVAALIFHYKSLIGMSMVAYNKPSIRNEESESIDASKYTAEALKDLVHDLVCTPCLLLLSLHGFES